MKLYIISLLLTSINSFMIKPILNYKINNRISMNYIPSEIISYVSKKGVGIEWTYNDFLENIKLHNIDSATLTDKNVLVLIDKNYDVNILPENLHILKSVPYLTDTLLSKLMMAGINFDILNTQPKGSFLDFIPFPLQLIGFYLLFSFILSFIRNNPNNLPINPNKFIKQGSNIIDSEDIDVSFSDVAGCDESKFELMEVVDFLKEPEKYKESGAKIPTGILLEGPPGTGKTLLARAVAGEANVGFISASGSEFIEMFVGVGASRVRNIFKTAEENKPCVIFIDEIDAIGRQRGAGFNSGNDEREQTLNQILTNMDGFDKTSEIIVIAATNRADILDSALTRPGRFDRKVIVPLPDKLGREALFNLNLKNKKYDKKLNIKALSELTNGFSGADINNLINEAAISTVRNNITSIDYNTIYSAFEKVTIGLPKKNDNRNNYTKKLVAYHESGHAIITKLFNDIFDLRKITINANYNGAGGYTLFTQKEKYEGFPTKKLLLAQLMISLGGRAAESILYENENNNYLNYNNNDIFEDINNLYITTGASNDLKQADSLARNYINLFGFNDTLTTFDRNNNEQPFLGRELAMNNNKISEYTKNKIDEEVNRLLNYAYNKTYDILKYNLYNLDYLSNLLLENKSINNEDINISVSYK